MSNTMKKLEQLVANNEKLARLLHLKKEEEIVEKKKNTALYVFAIIGAIAAIAAIVYAVYRYLNPVYIESEDLEDDNDELIEDIYVPGTASDTDFDE